MLQYFRAVSFLFPCFSYADYSRTVLICTSVQLPRDPCPGMHPPSARAVSRRAITRSACGCTRASCSTTAASRILRIFRVLRIFHILRFFRILRISCPLRILHDRR